MEEIIKLNDEEHTGEVYSGIPYIVIEDKELPVASLEHFGENNNKEEKRATL